MQLLYASKIGKKYMDCGTEIPTILNWTDKQLRVVEKEEILLGGFRQGLKKKPAKDEEGDKQRTCKSNQATRNAGQEKIEVNT